MVRMPELRDSPDYAVQLPPALANGHIAFGCCNNYSKITNEVICLVGTAVARRTAGATAAGTGRHQP